MTRLLVMLSLSAVVLITSNEAKPTTIQATRHPGALTQPLKHIQRDQKEVFQQYNQDYGISNSKSVQTTSSKLSRGAVKYEDVDSRPTVWNRVPFVRQRPLQKRVQRDESSGETGSVEPEGSTGSDSSTLFIDPTYSSSFSTANVQQPTYFTELLFNKGEPALVLPTSTPYAPASRENAGDLPLINNTPELHNPGVSYSPSGVPYLSGKEDPEANNRKTVSSQENNDDSNNKIKSSRIEGFDSSVDRRSFQAFDNSMIPSRIQGFDKMIPSRIQGFDNSFTIPQQKLNGSRIPLKLNDEVIRNPFLFNPDFFAFSQPFSESQLGKHSHGRPFGNTFGDSSTYNMEGTSIGEATFIVPENLGKGDVDFELPKPEPAQETFGLTIDDGQVIRNELRKETGEFIESYTTVDGTTRSETGVLVTTASGHKVMFLKGFYSYTSPDGQLVRVDYTSDETGYHATPSITKPAGR